MTKEFNVLDNKVKQLESQQKQTKLALTSLKKTASSSFKFAESVDPRVEQYALSILDPENHPVPRYPDRFVEPTSVYKAVNNEILPILSAANGIPEGFAYCEVHPGLADNVRVLNLNTSKMYCLNNKLAVAKNTDFTVTTSPKLVTNGDEQYIAGRFVRDEHFMDPMVARDTNGNTYPTYPAYQDDGGNLLFASIEVVSPGSGTVSLYMHSYNIDSAGVVTLLHSSSSFNITTIGTKLMTWDIPTGASAHPGIKSTFYAIHSSSTGTSPKFIIREFGGVLKFTHFLESRPVKDFDQISSTVDRYRTTVMSGLASYMGNQLTSAGQVSSVLYRGGINNWKRGLYTTEDIAELPLSYNGTAYDGSYGFWEALDRADMSYRHPSTHAEHSRPYLIFSFTLTDAEYGTADLRLRVVSGFEFVSNAQYYEALTEAPDREMVEQAALILSTVKNVMPNGSHSKILKNIFKKLKPAITKAAKWTWKNREDIIKTMERAGASLISLGVL